MAGLTLDTGALIAVEKHSRRIWTVIKRAYGEAATITVPAVVVAQAWRGNHAAVVRLLRGCHIEPMDEAHARAVGNLLAKASSNDIVDATVVLGAIHRNDMVVTSDPDDILAIAQSVGGQLKIIRL